MGFLGHHFFVVSILSPFARVLETTIRLHLYTLTCNRTQQIWDTHRYSIYSYFQSSSYWKVNTFSKHTCQHFPKKKYNQETTHLFNPPPPGRINQLNPPQKKMPKSPKACENILLDSSSHMSQLQWQGHRLPKTWRRRPGSSDPRSSLTWGPFLVDVFLGGVLKKNGR